MGKIKKIIRKLREGFLKKAMFELLWIYKLFGEFRKDILLCTGLSVLVATIGIGLTTFTKGIVDNLVQGQWDQIIKIGLMYAAIGVLNICMSMVSQRLSGVVNAKVRTKLSTKTYSKVLHADWESVIQLHSGDLMTRLQEDINSVAGSTVGWIPTVLSQGIHCAIALGIILYFDFSMILMVCVVAPIILVGSRIFLGKMYESNQLQRKISSDIMSLYKESFQHLQSIKSFNLIDHFVNNMDTKQQERQKNDLEVNKYSIASWSVMYASGQLAAGLCLAWAIYRVLTGALTLGTMTMLMMVAVSIAGNFKNMINLIPGAISTLASSERLRAVLELPEEQVENEEAYDVMLEDSKNGISLYMKDMSFSYANGKKVFNNVNYEVKPGEIVALVGPSGEGKTTMLRILLGIIQAQGECIISTEHYKLPIAIASRKLMSYVPQGNTMMNGTIADNLRMLKPDATEEEMIEALKDASAWEFVEKLPDGLYHKIGESGVGFSEGQNQRLAIARALMCNTPFLLLDEATSALDVATERKVLANLMKSVNKRTCILTTHRPSVLSMCDRVYRIADQTVTEVADDEIKTIMNEF